MSFSVPVTGLVISFVQMYRKSYCTIAGIGIGIGTMLKFYVKIFYVTGKVLSDELSCTRTGLVRLSCVLRSEGCQVRQSILWLVGLFCHLPLAEVSHRYYFLSCLDEVQKELLYYPWH